MDWVNQSIIEQEARNEESRLENMEWRPAEMRNYEKNVRRDGKGDEYGGGRDEGTTETAAS